MCKEYGASYLVSEMISSKGLCFGDKKTARLCEIEKEERPYALQLFGEDPYYMGKAAYINPVKFLLPKPCQFQYQIGIHFSLQIFYGCLIYLQSGVTDIMPFSFPHHKR